MDSGKLRAMWFSLALALAFGVPLAMIHTQTRILEKGTPVKIRTRPVDPYDPFRGRYVQLGFDDSNIPLADPAGGVERGDTLYAVLAIDEAGYGAIVEARIEEPADGFYIAAKARHASATDVWIDLPFDRYYMNERVAPEAERLYVEANRRALDSGAAEPFPDGNYALVRILDGAAAIEAVFLENQRIEDYARGALEAARSE